MGYLHRFRCGETFQLKDGTRLTLVEAGRRPLVRVEMAARCETEAEAPACLPAATPESPAPPCHERR